MVRAHQPRVTSALPHLIFLSPPLLPVFFLAPFLDTTYTLLLSQLCRAPLYFSYAALCHDSLPLPLPWQPAEGSRGSQSVCSGLRPSVHPSVCLSPCVWTLHTHSCYHSVCVKTSSSCELWRLQPHQILLSCCARGFLFQNLECWRFDTQPLQSTCQQAKHFYRRLLSEWNEAEREGLCKCVIIKKGLCSTWSMKT